MENRKALLIIDMQQGSFTAKTPRFDTIGTVNRINALADLFRAADCPVIFIQHNGTRENEFVPKTAEWELLSTLEVKRNDTFIEKYANDIFYKSDLETKLKELKINELFITGCATDFCVEATVQSAVAKDYNVIVVKDGHTTGDRPHISAEKVIEHYNWVWQNMIPTQGTVKVLDFEEIKKIMFR
ncbi:cysteine hydrolase family protein [Fulvivirgaceae bacterium BMA12]|uniref:Cysteine hydrolase family protein n=1 Tax=Agaribacillus aureus TaxID=3051825 RepID=A0ABT8LEX9_9BACT|nr:cysteine hydrolase family protein [Fulvivirgaceae bacterium BMA12]